MWSSAQQPVIRQLISRKILWRAAWLAVLLFHIPATYRVFLAAFVDGSHWTGALLIAATNLFFILEIVFGWSFKVLTDRRRILVFLLIIALLHVGVIDHALPGVSMTDFTAWIAISIGGAALLKQWLPVLRKFFMDRHLASLIITRQLRRVDYAHVIVNRRPTFTKRFLLHSLPHQAPPFNS